MHVLLLLTGAVSGACVSTLDTYPSNITSPPCVWAGDSLDSQTMMNIVERHVLPWKTINECSMATNKQAAKQHVVLVIKGGSGGMARVYLPFPAKPRWSQPWCGKDQGQFLKRCSPCKTCLYRVGSPSIVVQRRYFCILNYCTSLCSWQQVSWCRQSLNLVSWRRAGGVKLKFCPKGNSFTDSNTSNAS